MAEQPRAIERQGMPQLIPPSDPDALLCALVLVPGSYSRNQFFDIFEVPQLRRARRRAKRVRGIIRQLVGRGKQHATVLHREQIADRVLLRFELPDVSFQRTTSLTRIEAALVGYAVNRARHSPVDREDKELVEAALSRLGDTLGLPVPPRTDAVSPDRLSAAGSTAETGAVPHQLGQSDSSERY